MSVPPNIYRGSIIYPGGKSYHQGLASFKGKGTIPWTDYCYTMLDKEHLEDLINLANSLGLKLKSKPTKVDVCLILTDYYDKQLAAASSAAALPSLYSSTGSSSLSTATDTATSTSDMSMRTSKYESRKGKAPQKLYVPPHKR